MSFNTEKEYRVKRRAERQSGKNPVTAGKSAFTHKVKNGGKFYSRTAKERVYAKGASKEVLVKITGGAQVKQGVKNSIDYISREDTLKLTDADGNKIDTAEAKDYMIEDRDEDDFNLKTSKQPAITKNIVFSPPVSATVSPEDALESVRKVLSEKYPGHNFVLAWHDDKKDHPHVHAIIRMTDSDDARINIRKKDLRELRTDFCEKLKMKGYDVKATHKQIPGLKDKLKDDEKTAPKRMKGVMEVVAFGRAPYQFKDGNKPQNYITIKTLNKGVESTRWGKEFGALCEREQIKVGSLIKLKKTGKEEVKVPKLDKDGKQNGWLTTGRNKWQMENIGLKGIDRTQKLPEKSADLLLRQQQQRQFKNAAMEMIKKEYKIKIGLKF